MSPETQQTHRIGRLYFRTLASPSSSGPVFVLVHGIGMSHRYLARLHRSLTASGSVISVDLPGFGGLPKPGRDVDIEEMADGLAALLDRIGAGTAATGPVVLVGQSMGTQWVVELAARRPELAQAVVLIGPVADERRRTVLQQAGRLALDTVRETPGANALVFADYLRCGPLWYLAQLRHMLGYRIEDRIVGVEAPVLVVRGSRDPIASLSWSRHLTAAAQRAALVEIPGRAHNAQHTAPGAVASAVRHFCATDLAIRTREGEG
ncbi:MULTISPECIES: alpha/beta fold hydrolase [unclassified Microbacterium]|uniref:alpha/beta fold hydrolase n=1 Tax=unclassified Microbacterium TaxID=2609290 RepID=UPI002305AF85|nr:alpha/beta hydrolase [Microbacterium sp. nov. GSS16]WCD92169.1 alpha/beta hydrolase [Microbacterium sp. nov. GSS16]